MLRTWLTWGLSSAALLYTACGGGNENELFGNVKPGGSSGGRHTSIEPSLGEDGGSVETPGSPTGGEAAIGNLDAGSGGAPEAAPASGGQDAGLGGASPGGAAGESAAGANEPGSGGESSGGAANGSGGTESGGTTGGTETGGSETGGNESGGTTGGSETGGSGTGGSTGGTGTGGTGTGGTTGGTTGGSATGGQGGAAGCVVAQAQLQKLLNEAQECDPEARSACRSLVPDECECNNVPVGDPISDATSLYLEQLERVKKACELRACLTLECTDVTGHCSPRGEGRGHCVAVIGGLSSNR